MITYGFYDSKNHDRRYNARQFGSIFDGIVRDGIFMSIGTCFRVIPAEDMMVLVGAGRAWFDHTWTLNDAPLPVILPQSEVILDRIDAIVLDINADQSARVNSVMVVKGTPSKNPQRPALIKTKNRNQYPLAYISVRAGMTSIRAADITSMVGTSSTPYVTGILETVNIDALLDQWTDQWNEYFDFWRQEWERWYEVQTAEILSTYLDWKQEWEYWSNNYMADMESTADEWEDLWNAWFYSYINQNQQAFSNWQQARDSEFHAWFDSLQALLEPDVATNLANRILYLESCCGMVQDFMNNMINEHAVYDVLKDSNNNPVVDSEGEEIRSKIIFVIKE